MKNKSPLALMEQLVMIAVFALAAAVCVQASVTARLESRKILRIDEATSAASTAVELFKSRHDEDILASGAYDEDWTEATSGNPTYQVSVERVAPGERTGLLEGLRVQVTDTSGTETYADITGWRQMTREGG